MSPGAGIGSGASPGSGAGPDADQGLLVAAAPRQSPSLGWGSRSLGDAQRVVRYGPGVPALATHPAANVPGAAAVPAVPAAPAAPTAEEVWRHGLPGSGPRRPRPLRRLVGPGLTVVLLIASAVVIFLRLHHPAFGVNGVAITQVTGGCTVDVTGRISTTGGAGVVSYEWTFQPQRETPQPQSQTVTAGQTSVYVTAAVEGQGQGTLAQTATLRVLGSGQGSASAHIVISC